MTHNPLELARELLPKLQTIMCRQIAGHIGSQQCEDESVELITAALDGQAGEVNKDA